MVRSARTRIFEYLKDGGKLISNSPMLVVIDDGKYFVSIDIYGGIVMNPRIKWWELL